MDKRYKYRYLFKIIMKNKLFLITLVFGILLVGTFSFMYFDDGNENSVEKQSISFEELMESLLKKYEVDNYGVETYEAKKEFFNQLKEKGAEGFSVR